MLILSLPDIAQKHVLLSLFCPLTAFLYIHSELPKPNNTFVITKDIMLPPVNITIPTAPLHPNIVWPTANGINETEAIRQCEVPIKTSPVFALCQPFTVTALTSITTSCKLDLAVRAFNGDVLVDTESMLFV